MPYTLNLYSVIGQLYLNKTEGEGIQSSWKILPSRDCGLPRYFFLKLTGLEALLFALIIRLVIHVPTGYIECLEEVHRK